MCVLRVFLGFVCLCFVCLCVVCFVIRIATLKLTAASRLFCNGWSILHESNETWHRL